MNSDDILVILDEMINQNNMTKLLLESVRVLGKNWLLSWYML